MQTSHEIRQQFLDFFVEKHGHTFAPSSPVVPHGDPTLLFANAGMNQFKPYFLGTEQPPYQRAVNTQKCIRAGGKHNDLDDVGRDTYHHTFFEMLGNWSFGDYFKKEAIAWAWELLVDVWGLEPKRLHATYFEGDEALGLEPDLEARELWLTYLPAEQVHPGNKNDNFWEMGNTGPCGPCSELHYDGTDDYSGGPLVNADDPRVIEIWNLVFIQYNRDQDGTLQQLPAQHVDTGMGFERIVRVLQNKQSNYDTDVFTPLFDAIQKVASVRAYAGGPDTLEDPIDTAYRVIADHIRTLTFALSDGAHCGNEGRSYVLRRILRRAVRYGRQSMGIAEPFFYQLVPAVIDAMGDAFPELKKNPDAVAAELREEEESFSRTLDRGIALFERAADAAKGKSISGQDAFELYATYGFPLDLTQLMAQERGLAVDEEAFNQCWDEHVKISQGASDGVDVTDLFVEWVQKEKLAATTFTGDGQMTWSGQVQVRLLALDQVTALVTDQTPFYAESGGQVGDIGRITFGDAVFNVTDTRKVGDVFFHLGQFEQGAVEDNTQIQGHFEVDAARRQRIMANHTSTHLLNRALRLHVNPEADQRGSLVDDEKLRFDFVHHAPVTVEEVDQLEQTVNRDIASDFPVDIAYAAQEDAMGIKGLRAVFGEKYPPKVRVVSVGAKVSDLLANPDNDQWADHSIEFCGGTHLAKTGDAEGLCILSEEAVAKGVRRITALTGSRAHKATARGDMLLGRAEALKDQPVEQLADAVAAMSQTLLETPIPLLARHQIRQVLDQLQLKVKTHAKEQSKQAAGNVVEVAREVAENASGNLIVSRIAGADGKTLRDAMDVIRKKCPDAAMLLAADGGGGGTGGGKVAFLASVPKPLIAQGLKAGDWVREVAMVAGGGGGGRPDMAQAGGKDPAKIDDALAVAQTFAESKIS